MGVALSSMTTGATTEQDYYAPITIHGGNAGKVFKFPGWVRRVPPEFNPLKKIEVFVGEPPASILCMAAPRSIQGLRVTLMNGENKLFGTKTKRSKSFKLKHGECFTQLFIQNNAEGTHIGKFKFSTNKNRSFIVQACAELENDVCEVAVGSGICLGVVGSAGLGLNSLGFVFLREIQNSVLQNIKYDFAVDQRLELSTVQVNEITAYPPSADLLLQKLYTETYHWFLPEIFEYDLSAQVTSKAFIFKNRNEVNLRQCLHSLSQGNWGNTPQELTVTDEETRYEEVASVKDFVINRTDVVEVYQATRIEANIIQGDVHGLPFTAKIQVNLASEKNLVFKVSGSFYGRIYSDVVLKKQLVEPVAAMEQNLKQAHEQGLQAQQQQQDELEEEGGQEGQEQVQPEDQGSQAEGEAQVVES